MSRFSLIVITVSFDPSLATGLKKKRPNKMQNKRQSHTESGQGNAIGRKELQEQLRKSELHLFSL
jgi:hypothetical protein